MRTMTRRAALSALVAGGTVTAIGTGGVVRTASVGQAQTMQYRQGTILTWNPTTLNNTVEVDGKTFVDLPVLGVAEAAGFKLGAKVGVAVVGGSWAIIGRFVTPGTAEATDAITDLSQRLISGFVSTAEAIPTGAFADLPSFGPEVTVRIGVSGQALVILGAQMQVLADGILYGYAVSGANTIAASSNNDLFFRSTTPGQTVSGQHSLVDSLTGLTPGLSTFTAKYTASIGGGNLISRRRLAVLAL